MKSRPRFAMWLSKCCAVRNELDFRFGMELDASHRSVERAFSEHLLRGDAGDLAGFDLVESALGLLEPDLLGVAVGLRIEAGNEALGEPSALLGRELKGLGLDLPRRAIHDKTMSQLVLCQRRWEVARQEGQHARTRGPRKAESRGSLVSCPCFVREPPPTSPNPGPIGPAVTADPIWPELGGLGARRGRHCPHNPKVAGSNPVPATKELNGLRHTL